MSKKTIGYTVILLILAGFAIYLIYNRNEKSTFELKDQERYAFTISDTASVDKIIIKDKTPKKVELTRTDNGNWLVNGKDKVRKDAMRNLLETLKRMEMRNFLPEGMQETAIKRMMVYGKEVEIYKDGKLFKTIYVGTESQDEMATYMMLKGSDQPFAVHIPGFNGFLSTRFFTESHLWRSRDLFTLAPQDIAEIKMYYPDSLDASFKLKRVNPDSVYIEGYKNNKILAGTQKIKMNLFMAAFKRLSYEGAIIESDPIYARKDSLLASPPVFELQVTTTSGSTKSVKGYKIKAPEEVFYDDEPMEWDRDRMHGIVDDNIMVLLQYQGLSNVMVGKDFFTKSEI